MSKNNRKSQILVKNVNCFENQALLKLPGSPRLCGFLAKTSGFHKNNSKALPQNKPPFWEQNY
jgi:hypothetical protein